MSENNPPAVPKKVVIGALIAGMAAGGALLYVTGAPDGNQAVETASVDGGSCPASAARAEAAGSAAKGHVAAMLVTENPKPLATMAFNGPDGGQMTLGTLSGKTLLVNLWATWCAPCRAEMPALDRLQASMGGEDFQVVAINIDTGGDEKPTAFLEEIGVSSLAYYRDASMGVFNDMKKEGLAFGLPVTLLVDEDSCLVASMNGPAEWDSADAAALIEAVKTAK